MTDAKESSALKQVILFTDGAAVPNPGAGGYGIVLRFGNHRKELSGGFQRTTNNRMELMAAIIGLESIKERCKVTLHSDSQYIVEAVTTGAAFRWRSNGWKFKPLGAKLIKNPDLWERLLSAYDKHDVNMVWVKGHAGIADNERCDTLAMAACKQGDLPSDPGYVEVAREEPPRAIQSETLAPRDNRKIDAEGQECRHCGTAVVKRTRRANRKIKSQQRYFYAWYLFCPNCKAMYLVEEAKQEIGRDEPNKGLF